MAEDKRAEFIHDMEINLVWLPEAERIRVIDQMVKEISKYEIMDRCTEIALLDNSNEKILKRYCACLFVDGKSEKTVKVYQYSIWKFAEFIQKPFTEVGPYDIRLYLAQKKQGGSSNMYLENLRSYLAAFYKWMQLEEMITKNPMGTIKTIKVEKELKTAFSQVEMDALRGACQNLKERAVIEMLISSGVRVEELSNIDVTDLDFDKTSVHVRKGKGGKDRITYMTDVAVYHVKKYLLARKEEGNVLIYNKYGDRISTQGIRSIVKNVGARACVENVHPHRFRRTFATGLASRGMEVHEIQRLMGHSNINTTMTYICTDDKNVAADYRKFAV